MLNRLIKILSRLIDLYVFDRFTKTLFDKMKKLSTEK